MPSNLAALFIELAQMQQIYSGTCTMFFDHGFGTLRITIGYGKTKKEISIHVERLSADLEPSTEVIEVDRADVFSTLCHLFNISEESLLRMCQLRKEWSLPSGKSTVGENGTSKTGTAA
jgi:hypothetical protein